MARIRGLSVAVWWVALLWVYRHDPAFLFCLAAALLLAGPLIRLAVMRERKTEIQIPGGPSQHSLLVTASCLSIVKTALGAGLLPRHPDHLADRS